MHVYIEDFNWHLTQDQIGFLLLVGKISKKKLKQIGYVESIGWYSNNNNDCNGSNIEQCTAHSTLPAVTRLFTDRGYYFTDDNNGKIVILILLCKCMCSIYWTRK